MRHVIEHLIARLEQGESVVLAAVVKNTGSAPRTTGARMLVSADGGTAGSVGGSSVEGECCREAQNLFQVPDQYKELQFNLTAGEAASSGMICGGAVTILLHQVNPAQLSFFRDLFQQYRLGTRPILLTALPCNGKPPEMMSVLSEKDLSGFDLELVHKLGSESGRKSHVVSHNGREFFVEPLVRPGTVHIVGGGHVGLATGHLAAYAGFDVIVMDDRGEFANKERFPSARSVQVLENFQCCFKQLGADDYVVIVTRGHMYDREVLAQALQTRAGYIGMIGSSKKRKAIYQSLLLEGFTEEDLQRVHSPIGLSIGADTPEELGFSIVAELIKVRAEQRV